jgi:UDP:flavonoid glycosyltransferase YjiC (YdhE family)
MRILTACTGGTGHFLPFVPFLDHARRNGGQTLVVAHPSLEGMVETTGHPFKPASPDKGFGRVTESSLLVVMEQAIRDFRPDVILRDPFEIAAATVVGWLGVPAAQIATNPAKYIWDKLDSYTPDLEALRGGLTDEVCRSPFLTRLPASLDISPFPLTLRYREPAGVPGGALPAWWADSVAPLIYVTFGTMTGAEWFPEQAYPTVIDAVTGLDARVLVTVGSRDFDMSQLRHVPGNVHVEAWVDRADAMGAADLVVCHGGAGTVYGALAAGVPLVVIPIIGDQFANATAVTRAGAGIEVVTGQDSQERRRPVSREDAPKIRQVIETVLADGSYRQAAAAVAAEMAAAPTIETLLGQLPGAGYSTLKESS